jgi:protein TonB
MHSMKIPTLEVALVISLLLHGTVLSIHFGAKLPRQLHNSGLDVILVNSRSAKKPKDVQALAQVDQDGGGTTDENKIATSPLPPSPVQQSGAQTAQSLQRRLEQLEKQRRILTAQDSKNRARLAEVMEKTEAMQSPTDGHALAESALELARLQAQVDRNLETYNKRPRMNFEGARTLGIAGAQYIEDWRQKVERIGTLNYPPSAKGRISGALVLTVQIDKEGNVVDVVIEKTSGHKVLDEAAKRVVRLASPYPPLPPSVVQTTDILVITRVWKFTPDKSLETTFQP